MARLACTACHLTSQGAHDLPYTASPHPFSLLSLPACPSLPTYPSSYLYSKQFFNMLPWCPGLCLSPTSTQHLLLLGSISCAFTDISPLPSFLCTFSNPQPLTLSPWAETGGGVGRMTDDDKTTMTGARAGRSVAGLRRQAGRRAASSLSICCRSFPSLPPTHSPGLTPLSLHASCDGTRGKVLFGRPLPAMGHLTLTPGKGSG